MSPHLRRGGPLVRRHGVVAVDVIDDVGRPLGQPAEGGVLLSQVASGVAFFRCCTPQLIPVTANEPGENVRGQTAGEVGGLNAADRGTPTRVVEVNAQQVAPLAARQVLGVELCDRPGPARLDDGETVGKVP